MISLKIPEAVLRDTITEAWQVRHLILLMFRMTRSVGFLRKQTVDITSRVLMEDT